VTPEAAQTRLEAMTSASVDPTLTSAELVELLAMAARPDVDGLFPSDVDWTGTWDLAFAAAEGWRWKAGKVSERFAASLDGAGLQRQQLHQHCLAMATRYDRRVVGTAQIGNYPPVSIDDVVVN